MVTLLDEGLPSLWTQPSWIELAAQQGPQLSEPDDKWQAPHPLRSGQPNNKQDFERELTLNHCILTGLLIVLTSAADPVGKPIALMLECLTMLKHWDMSLQLVLNKKNQ